MTIDLEEHTQRQSDGLELMQADVLCARVCVRVSQLDSLLSHCGAECGNLLQPAPEQLSPGLDVLLLGSVCVCFAAACVSSNGTDKRRNCEFPCDTNKGTSLVHCFSLPSLLSSGASCFRFIPRSRILFGVF